MCLFDNAYLTRSPVVSQVEVTDSLGKSLDNLLHRCSRVGSVCVDNIDVVLLKTLEGTLETLDNVLLGKSASVGFLATGSEEDLRV